MKLVVALGGNALQAANKPATAQAQLGTVKATVVHLADLIASGHQIVIVHGNGPQVGRLVLQNEYAKPVTPPMPFDVCGAMSQGMIGYHIQQALQEELHKRHIHKPVVTLLTQVVVDPEDEGFRNPTKPIGPFYTKEEAEILQNEQGYVLREDAGRGYRRVVASPAPKRIVELETVQKLVSQDHVVITVGGGGIPVIEAEDQMLEGIAAVIDKDLAAERLAEDLRADGLLILTAVEKVALDYGKPEQRNLDRLTVENAQQYIEDGQFADGSMLPKVRAGVKFVTSQPGRLAIITSLEKAGEALTGTSGTRIVP
ncbi:carbamate kinase [Sporomusa acidovorans]|uniref:Carbamate kinase n=1 Tax=Sporomusa acidovorans (strain ATCC 49682 / DSM 3132 / Mol) TaxID=1123286 RepID=A0ABZ3JBS2_SPOA4|nr:carbamate kinase [Sporomusa acidovorans]OZC13241.1 carbamate kinase 1 [Sporomusa acidovorans DSM 3132]SDE00040.1 carbamate kinase [Sporomusa acidovorans]